MSSISGICIVTVDGTGSIVFPNRAVMEAFVKNLQNYLDTYGDEDEVMVFSFADETYPTDKLRDIARELRDRFS